MDLLVSFNLGGRYVMHCVNDFGFVSRFFMSLLKQLVIFLLMESKVFNQKLKTLSIIGDFHFCDFLSAFCRFLTIKSLYTCSSNSWPLFSSLFDCFSIFIIVIPYPPNSFQEILYFIFSWTFLNVHLFLS